MCKAYNFSSKQELKKYYQNRIKKIKPVGFLNKNIFRINKKAYKGIWRIIPNAFLFYRNKIFYLFFIKICDYFLHKEIAKEQSQRYSRCK